MSDPAPWEPFVSIIVPCRNELGHIVPCLESLLAQRHPREKLEVFFLDGMSADGTREILEEAARKHPFMRVLDNPRKIVPTAMNLGIKHARGEVIVRMDAHSEYPPDYLPRVLKLLRDTEGAGNAGGRVITTPNGDGPWARPVAFVTSHGFGVGYGRWRTSDEPGLVDTVPNGAFRREVLEKVGLFDERLTRNQDNELNARLWKAGYKVAFDPTIRIRYYNQSTLAGLLHQGFHTGAWNIYTLFLHPYTWKWRRFVPAAFAAYVVALACAVAAAPPAPLAAAALFPLALYAVLVAAISLSPGARAVGGLRVAATFAAYHLAYGFGTHSGVLNLVTGRWRRRLGQPLKP